MRRDKQGEPSLDYFHLVEKNLRVKRNVLFRDAAGKPVSLFSVPAQKKYNECEIESTDTRGWAMRLSERVSHSQTWDMS